MNQTNKRRCKLAGRRGVTLIEIIAAVAMLALLLGSSAG